MLWPRCLFVEPFPWWPWRGRSLPEWTRRGRRRITRAPTCGSTSRSCAPRTACRTFVPEASAPGATRSAGCSVKITDLRRRCGCGPRADRTRDDSGGRPWTRTSLRCVSALVRLRRTTCWSRRPATSTMASPPASIATWPSTRTNSNRAFPRTSAGTTWPRFTSATPRPPPRSAASWLHSPRRPGLRTQDSGLRTQDAGRWTQKKVRMPGPSHRPARNQARQSSCGIRTWRGTRAITKPTSPCQAWSISTVTSA